MRLVAQHANASVQGGSALEIRRLADADDFVARIISQHLGDVAKLSREVLVDEEVAHTGRLLAGARAGADAGLILRRRLRLEDAIGN